MEFTCVTILLRKTDRWEHSWGINHHLQGITNSWHIYIWYVHRVFVNVNMTYNDRSWNIYGWHKVFSFATSQSALKQDIAIETFISTLHWKSLYVVCSAFICRQWLFFWIFWAHFWTLYDTGKLLALLLYFIIYFLSFCLVSNQVVSF